MDLIYQISVALSVGILVGFAAGGIKLSGHRNYTQEQKEKGRAAWKRLSGILIFLTFLILVLGLVWCVYYLILGAVRPAQAEYATSMSQLIVSVLTIVSILMALFEFLRKQ